MKTQLNFGIFGALFVAWLPLLFALWLLRHRYGSPRLVNTVSDPAAPTGQSDPSM